MVDTFEGLAHYYDRIMSHVDYDRWFAVGTALADLLPRPIRHLDAACGTAVFLQKLRQVGWGSMGIDLSGAMLRMARKTPPKPPVAQADVRALPFRQSFGYITCLFDSINFLLEPGDVRRAFREFAGALTDGGLLYFDAVTERMVKDHFAGQRWQENNGGFSTRWESDFKPEKRLCETRIRVNNGPLHTIYERVYDLREIEAALEAAGLTLLGAFDAESWRPIRKRTIRIDFLAVKGGAETYGKRFESIAADIRLMLA